MTKLRKEMPTNSDESSCSGIPTSVAGGPGAIPPYNSVQGHEEGLYQFRKNQNSPCNSLICKLNGKSSSFFRRDCSVL